LYTSAVPRLWTETIEGPRREVHAAILGTAAALVGEHGLASVTMSQIAEEAGIGRATLYKYFPDVEAILAAWHERHVTHHLERLTEVRDRATDPAERLEVVLEAYASISQERARAHPQEGTQADAHEHSHARSPQRSHAHSADHPHPPFAMELAAYVHRGTHVARAEGMLRDFIKALLIEAAKAGAVRDDVDADELAVYCINALGAASTLRSKPAVQRLVAVTLAGLRPPRRAADRRSRP
jgi:AcrR family transcriptional regulator